MEPNTNPSPNYEAAPRVPQPEQTPAAPLEQAPAAPSPERLGPAGEGANQNAGMSLPPPVLQPAPAPQLQQQPTTPATAQTAPQPLNTPPVADDVDVIEKEWVEKAKDIVEKTAQDPRAQNREVSALKADYMKKRYNKDIKLQNE